MENLKEQMDKEGYVVIPNIFSSEEIDDIALRVESSAKKNIEAGLANDDSKAIEYVKNSKKENFVVIREFLSRPELEDYDWLILNERIVKIFQALIKKPFCYFGESSAHIGTGNRGFHKDNISRDSANHDDWKSNYDVFRLALYTQDTKSYSGGLQIRKKSHLVSSKWIGRPINIRLKKGDIVVWKLTLTHSGNTLLPRFFPNFPYLLPRLTSMMPHWFFRPYEKSRVALFMTFGASNSKHTNNYIEYIKNGRDDWHPFNPTLNNKKIAAKRKVDIVEQTTKFGKTINS